jgi:methylmalonyl-CoA mutase cobalamin-binding subunit
MTMTAASYMAEALKKAGVKRIYGIVGPRTPRPESRSKAMTSAGSIRERSTLTVICCRPK